MLAILKNAWYAAAYSHEVDEGPLKRTLIENTVVIFRDANGVAGMIQDRCPHRFASLSAGKVIGDAIECPYHGLRFNNRGQCVLNPHAKNKGPLRAADIPAWPVMERYGIIWFWPGDPAQADESNLPVIDFLEKPDEYGVVSGLLHVEGHYELVVDNLLDLSHAAFLHPQFSGGNYTPEELLAATTQKLERRERSIVNHRIRRGLGPSSAHVALFGMDPKSKVVTDTTMTWHPPAMLDFALGSWGVDQEREEGVHIPQLHIITPETEFTSHYFFVNGRNRRLGEKEVDDALLDFFEMAFAKQDEPMIEMVQENMGKVSDIMSLNPILLSTDAAPVSARRMLAALIEEERAEEAAEQAKTGAPVA